MSAVRLICELAGKARLAGMVPREVEIDLHTYREITTNLPRTLGFVDYLCGLRIRCRDQPGIAVLALPDRRIGKFEIVPMRRFEATPP